MPHGLARTLTPYAVFAAVLSAAGLPIYIHAPKVYADQYGVSLAALGAVLFGLRLLDLVQDPLLGRLAQYLRGARGLAAALAVALMALGMLALFAVVPPVTPLLWFALSLTLVFSCFSFLNILFYATGVATAASLVGQGHLRLARWRETGALLGICLAALLPTLAEGIGVPPFATYALLFALLCAGAGWLMRDEWARARPQGAPQGFGPILGDATARRLMLIALVNAAPVAVTSTLFLFFVESRLQAPGWEGPLLLLFFLSAAVAAPGWGFAAERFGAKPVLLAAMVLAMGAFGWALVLGAGDTRAFAVICLASGAAVGADLTLLPALFARRMAVIAPDASAGFALWSFVNKATLAVAAVGLLPVLQAVGFRTEGPNDPGPLQVLGLLYAGVPIVLKGVALALLAATHIEKEEERR